MSRKRTSTPHEVEDQENRPNVDSQSQNGQSASSAEGDSAEQNGSPVSETSGEQKPSPEQVIEILQRELSEAKDKYIRLTAEFDNYRKRTLKEKTDLIKYGSEDVLRALLPVLDDFERAIQSTEKSTDIEAVKQGLNLVHLKVKDFLREKGVKEIEAVGLELDTDQHEAITKTPVSNPAQKGKVVDVVERGYMLYDKVIRFAKVVIGE